VRRPFFLVLATGFGVGYSAVAPGTLGSLVGLLLSWLLSLAIGSVAIRAALLLALVLGSVPVCSWAASHFGRPDPSQVVLDELVAMPIALLLVPFTWQTATVGFLWFRLFDIVKPWPVAVVERWPGGWGIVADDVAAAVLAGVATLGTQFLCGWA